MKLAPGLQLKQVDPLAAASSANAAFAVAKAATAAALDLNEGTLSAADRDEVLAIALRTLQP